jgi:hypothetical protein
MLISLTQILKVRGLQQLYWRKVGERFCPSRERNVGRWESLPASRSVEFLHGDERDFKRRNGHITNDLTLPISDHSTLNKLFWPFDCQVFSFSPKSAIILPA